MLVTVLEAKQKWCHVTIGTNIARCEGSECMAWRWAEYTPHLCVKCGAEDEDYKDLPEERRGYCGLAGASKF